MSPDRTDDTRLSSHPETLKRAFLDHLLYTQGKSLDIASRNDLYQALAHTVRDRMLRRWSQTSVTHKQQGTRTVAYLSAEFLMGPMLGNNLLNLGITDEVRQAMQELGFDLDDLLGQESEPGLGNGGLGRLAACFIDSLATHEVPALGYGIHYEYGIFHQTLIDGWQVENTDKWLRFGNPWQVHHAEWGVEVKLGGHTEHYTDEQGRFRVRWVAAKTVSGTPLDLPILGYQVNTVNTLRLWRAEATEAFDFSVFNRGDYLGAVSRKVTSE
nr:glycogen/starch/alpha-glucan phosphorylase [Pseudomonas sp.]